MSNEKKFDEITKAKHYNQHPSGVECIDIIKHHDFNTGNVIKYVWRAGLKEDGPLAQSILKDLMKARYYLEKAIEMYGGKLKETEAERFKREANEKAHVAIERMRQMTAAQFQSTFSADRKREEIQESIEKLLMDGIDISDPPEVVFQELVRVVHVGGAHGFVDHTDFSGNAGFRRYPICVRWDATQPEGVRLPDYGRNPSWHRPEDLALEVGSGTPVQLNVTITDSAPHTPRTAGEVADGHGETFDLAYRAGKVLEDVGLAVPTRPRAEDSTTSVSGDSPEPQL